MKRIHALVSIAVLFTVFFGGFAYAGTDSASNFFSANSAYDMIGPAPSSEDSISNSDSSGTEAGGSVDSGTCP